MHIQRYPTAAAFREATLPFLVAQEAENNLILGVSTAALNGEYEGELYFATVTDAGGAVLLAAMRTPPHNLLLSTLAAGTDDNAALRLVMDDVLDIYGEDLPGVNGSTSLARAFAGIWAARTDCESSVAMSQRIYKLTTLTVPDTPGHLRAAAEADRPLLMKWVKAFYAEALSDDEHEQTKIYVANVLNPKHSRELFLWEVDGEVVSMAGFTGATPNGMRVGPVYTPPEHRRRGYGAAVTAGVTRVLLNERGRSMTFLYTDLSNPTSNKIYQQIGYRPVLDVDMLRFRSAD